MSTFAAPPPSSHPPRRPPPRGACDTHAHIFGPVPVTGPSAYLPPLAPYESYRAMLHAVGVDRGVLVQPAAYRFDHRALLDACARSGGALKGVGLADRHVSDEDLRALRQGGVVGLRFVEIANPAGGGRYPGSVGFDDLLVMAPRLKALGLQAHLWAGLEQLLQWAPKLLGLGLDLVIDHMGGVKADRDRADAPAFRDFLSLVREGRWWVKLALCRTSENFPDYPDTSPFHDALLAANPGRLLWGSDWPHLRLGERTPDVGHLLDLFDRWTGGDDGLSRRILVENPQSLFGFTQEVTAWTA